MNQIQNKKQNNAIILPADYKNSLTEKQKAINKTNVLNEADICNAINDYDNYGNTLGEKNRIRAITTIIPDFMGKISKNDTIEQDMLLLAEMWVATQIGNNEIGYLISSGKCNN